MKRLFAQSTKREYISNQYLATQKERTKKIAIVNDEHGKRFFAEVGKKKKSLKNQS